MIEELTIVLIFACYLTSTDSFTLSKMKVTGSWITDDQNRIRLFRGFNSVTKKYPWYENLLLNDTILDFYPKFGFNVVRLGAMWAGVEPTEGFYNETYLDVLEEIVRKFDKRNMYVLLDMHQDVLSSGFGNESYEGIPRWLIDKFKPSKHRYPWPFKSISPDNWALGYLTEEVSMAFQQLYDNAAGAVNKLSKFWEKVASRFKNHKNVIGYELINEPWAGNIYKLPQLLEPGVAGRKNLQSFYDKLSAGIRTIDPYTLIFYEPVTWSIFSHGNKSGIGLTSVPGGRQFANMSVLSYHYYCWLITPDILSHQYNPLLRTVCDGLFGSNFMSNIAADIENLGGSSFMTEFGDCSPDNDELSINTIECNFILDLADRYFQSWMYWDNIFFRGSEILTTSLKSFSRPYPRAISGIPKSSFYDRITKEFKLTFQPSKNSRDPTEIFVPRLIYPDGFKMKVSNNLKYRYNVEDTSIYLYYDLNRVEGETDEFIYIFV